MSDATLDPDPGDRHMWRKILDHRGLTEAANDAHTKPNDEARS